MSAATLKAVTDAARPDAPPAVKFKVEVGELSCWRTYRTPRGRFLRRTWFDVPCEDFKDGSITGRRIALELVRWVRAQPDDMWRQWRVQHMLCQAGAIARGPNSDSDGRVYAAESFLHTMATMAVFCVAHLNAEDVAQHWVEWAECNKSELASRQSEQKRQLAPLEAVDGGAA